jgi:hypothetical protein
MDIPQFAYLCICDECFGHLLPLFVYCEYSDDACYSSPAPASKDYCSVSIPEDSPKGHLWYR